MHELDTATKSKELRFNHLLRGFQTQSEPLWFSVFVVDLFRFILNYRSLLLYAITLFIGAEVVGVSVFVLKETSLLEGSYASHILDLSRYLATYGTYVVLFLQALVSSQGDLNNLAENENNAKTKKFFVILLIIWIGYFVSFLVRESFFGGFKGSVFSLKGIFLLSVLAATTSFFNFDTVQLIKANPKQRKLDSKKLLLALFILIINYLFIFVLSETYLFICSFLIILLGVGGTAFFFTSISDSIVWFKSTKYLLSWLFAISLTLSILYSSHIVELKKKELIQHPQLLQLISDEIQNSEIKLPEPDLMVQAIKGKLRQNQVEVYVIPYSFYKKAKTVGEIVPLDKKYDAVFIFPYDRDTTKNYVDSDTLELIGQNVELQFVYDNSGPLLNNDKNSRPILVLNDPTFLSLVKKSSSSLISIKLWQDEDMAKSAERVYKRIGLSDFMSSNESIIKKITLTSKSTMVFSSVVTILAFLLLVSSFNFHLDSVGGLLLTLGVSLYKCSAMLAFLIRFQPWPLFLPLMLGLAAIILFGVGIYFVKIDFKSKSLD